MAAPVCCLRTVIHGCQKHILKQTGICSPSPFTSSYRSWTAVRFYVIPAGVKIPAKRLKKEEKPRAIRLSALELVERRKDTSRIKPYGLTAWKPVDDVYVARYYAKPVIEPEAAIENLKTFQKLDFTSPDQAVYIHLKLDMKLEKKKKVDPFVGYIHLPFPFIKEKNKVLVFTEKLEEIEIARNAGAAVGGAELIPEKPCATKEYIEGLLPENCTHVNKPGTPRKPEILNDKVQADFYIATPDIISKLNVLKNKLRKKFPKTKRGSVGNDIANMVKLFESCYDYVVVQECLVRTKIATLDMPLEHIIANIDTLIKDVCEHKPLHFGPFVESAILASATSEGLHINFQKFLPQEPVKTEEE